ncbi:MAG TPA: ATP-grasp domain-containing protein [Streptosporangiaceae bacterium]
MSTIVVYEQGAVTPMRLLGAVGAGRQLIVILSPSEHARRMRPLFAETCVAVYDLTDADLRRRLADHKPTGILTFSEPMLRATAELAADLGLPYHELPVVDRLTSKYLQRTRLNDAGVDPTVSVRITAAEQWEPAVREVGLPAVVKPVRGVSSRNTMLIDSVAAGRERIGELLRVEGAVVVDEYLPGIDVPDPFGDYLSVESLVQRGVRTHLAITGKLRLAPPFRECGQFWPARLDRTTREGVLALTDQAIKALEVTTGILHTEIKLTPDGPRVIEVNGRVGGYIPELARYAAGIDLVDAGIRIAGGERVDVPELDLDRVCFQFTTPAPVARGVVTRVCDAAAVRAVPGVTAYHPLARPGTEVGGFGTQDLNLLEGEAADHEALAATVDLIMDRVEYGFDFGGGPTVRSARDLVYTTGSDSGRGE